MMIRLVHLTVAASLVAAAAFVYKIKLESTERAAEAARLAAELRRERDAVAALRVRFEQLANPARIQGLAERHLALRQLDPAQIDRLDHLLGQLPARRAPPGGALAGDPIGALIEALAGGRPEERSPAAGSGSKTP